MGQRPSKAGGNRPRHFSKPSPRCPVGHSTVADLPADNPVGAIARCRRASAPVYHKGGQASLPMLPPQRPERSSPTKRTGGSMARPRSSMPDIRLPFVPARRFSTAIFLDKAGAQPSEVAACRTVGVRTPRRCARQIAWRAVPPGGTGPLTSAPTARSSARIAAVPDGSTAVPPLCKGLKAARVSPGGAVVCGLAGRHEERRCGNGKETLAANHGGLPCWELTGHPLPGTGRRGRRHGCLRRAGRRNPLQARRRRTQ